MKHLKLFESKSKDYSKFRDFFVQKFKINIEGVEFDNITKNETLIIFSLEETLDKPQLKPLLTYFDEFEWTLQSDVDPGTLSPAIKFIVEVRNSYFDELELEINVKKYNV
jgi:hypothetical protein